MLSHSRSLDLGVQAPDGVLACHSALLAPPRLAAAWAWLNQGRLDAALAAGADPRSSEPLAARAAQLTSRRSRDGIAAALERVALSPQSSSRRSAIQPLRGAVERNRAQLLELAARVRGDAPAYVRGLAGARLIVTDGTGPAYTDPRGEALARELELVSAALLS